jgi:ABC-type transporter Mla subunit MlaD
LLGVTIYYAGNEQWGSHFTPYVTYLRYAGGIAPGTQVLFGGIEAGRVTAVRAWDKDPTLIEISLAVKDGTPLNAKSIASLGAVSLMSSPSISITTGAQDARRLRAGETVQSQETVSIDDMTRKLAAIADGAGSLLTEVQGELRGMTRNANTLLANLNSATGPENRKQIAEMLQRVNGLVTRESPKLDRITDQALVIAQNADAVMRKVGPVVDHADAAIGNVNATVTNANATINQLRDPMRQDIAQLQSTMEQAKILIASLQSVVRGNDGNIRETLENIRIATETLDELSDQVNQRPWSLIRIRQQKDRKVPK